MSDFNFQAQVSSLGCLAISFILGGLVLLLAGTSILDIKAVTIARNRKTVAFSILMILFGLGGLLFDMGSTTTEAPAVSIPKTQEREIIITIAANISDPTYASVEEAIQRYMETHPGVEIRLLDTPDLETGRLGWYRQLFNEHSSEVDIYQIDLVWAGDLAEYLVDLYEYGASEVVNDHFPATIENITIDGRLVGMPWYIDVGLLYYRTDLLKKYDYDGPPKTWDELETMARTIQKGERAEGKENFWGFVWPGKAHEVLTCNALEWIGSQGGGTIVSPGGRIAVNNPSTVKAVERAASWVGDISPPEVTSFDEEDSIHLWQAGNAAFMRSWPNAYLLGNKDSSAIRHKFDVAPLPAGQDGQSVATLGGWQFAVSKYSKHPDAAADVVFFLVSKEEQKIRAIRTDGSFNPSIKSLYQDPELLREVPFIDRLPDVFTNLVARPSKVTAPEYSATSFLFSKSVHSVLTGEKDAQAALEELELDLENLLHFEVGTP